MVNMGRINAILVWLKEEYGNWCFFKKLKLKGAFGTLVYFVNMYTFLIINRILHIEDIIEIELALLF